MGSWTRSTWPALTRKQCFKELHSKGIVHCDIKPRIIFRLNDGHLSLCDLDASARVEDTCSGKSSFAYLSPEGAWGRFRLHPKGLWVAGDQKPLVACSSLDMWCLGAVAFELGKDLLTRYY